MCSSDLKGRGMGGWIEGGKERGMGWWIERGKERGMVRLREGRREGWVVD